VVVEVEAVGEAEVVEVVEAVEENRHYLLQPYNQLSQHKMCEQWRTNQRTSGAIGPKLKNS
jgi:hypothetical protein